MFVSVCLQSPIYGYIDSRYIYIQIKLGSYVSYFFK